MKFSSKSFYKSTYMQFQDQSITSFLNPFPMDILLIFDHRNGLYQKETLSSNTNLYRQKFSKYKKK